MQGDAARCKALRRDGRPCRAPALPTGAGLCFVHDPGRQAALAGERAAGGRAKATALRAERLVPATLRPVITDLLDALQGVRAGSLSPAQGTAIAALAGALVRVYQLGEVEQRLRDLEAATVAAETGG